MTFKELPNLGFLQHEFTTDELAPIWKEVLKIQNTWTGIPFNQELVGNIRKEYLLSDCREHVSKLIIPLALKLNNITGYGNQVYIAKTTKPMILDDIWVNYMSKGEFNPVHDHRGIFSFVIWLKLPYTFKEEDALMPEIPKEKNFSGQFVIHYTDIVGNIKNYPMPTDKRLEGHGLIFPSRLRHSVYPFYSSDEYRISVSGNVLVDV